jgi:hypothetical protein
MYAIRNVTTKIPIGERELSAEMIDSNIVGAKLSVVNDDGGNFVALTASYQPLTTRRTR